MFSHTFTHTQRFPWLMCWCLLALLGSVAASHSATARGDSWMFQHDPQHRGLSAFSGPADPVQKWKLALGAPVFSTPAIAADGTIYFGALDDNLYAIDPATASLKWQFTTGGYIWSSPAIGTDGTVYIGSDDDNLYALNPDGTPQWQFTAGDSIESSPAIGVDGTIYVGSNDSNLYALNPDGSLKWKYTTGAGIDSSPAIAADGTIYIGSADHNLYALNPDGSLQWTYTTNNSIQWSSPAIGADGTIYIGSDDFNLYALNPKDGSLQWSYPTQSWIYSTPAIGADGTIYICSLDDNLYALNPKDGSLQWKYDAGGSISSSPLLDANGTVYIGTGFGQNTLYALDAANGSLKWQYLLGGGIFANPVLGADGTLYLAAGDANLYALTQAPLMPMLSLRQSVTIPDTAPGSTMTCMLAYANSGAIQATNITLTDVLPADLSYVPGSAGSNATYTAATRTLRWSVSPLAFNGNGRATFQAQISTGATPGSTIDNQAELICTGMAAPVQSNVFSFVVGAPTRGDRWMFQHDAQHSGCSPVNGPSGPWLKWKFATGYEVYSSPAFGADGTIYLPADIYLYALDPLDGSIEWQYLTGGHPRHPGGRHGRDDLFGCSNNYFYALNPDGSLKWSFLIDNSFALSSPAIGTDGTIYVGSDNYNLYALNPADGSVKWIFTAHGVLETSPAIGADGTIYIGGGFPEHNLYAVNPTDGSLKWLFSTGDPIDGSPSIGADGTIYVGSSDHNFYALNPNGSLKWKFTAGYYVGSTAAIGPDGSVYVGSEDCNLYAFNPDGSRGGRIPQAMPSIPPRSSARTARSISGRATIIYMRSTRRMAR